MAKLKPTQGFTLIELMVVLLIISILTTLAVVHFDHATNTRRTHIQLQKIKASIENAKLRAILESAIFGLVMTKTGYRFYRYHEDKRSGKKTWQPLSHDVSSNAHAFSNDLQWKIKAATLHLTTNDAIHPILLIFPDGSITPFTLTIMDKNHRLLTLSMNNGKSTKRLHLD